MTAATALSVSVHAQVSVESDGCVKVGNLSNAKNVSGNSLDVAVNKVYMYMAPNGSGSFSIYNNSKSGATPGPIVVVPGTSADPSRIVGGLTEYNMPTYIEPLNAGRLILGTSAKPLGNIYAGTVYASGQQLTSDHRAKRNIRSLENSRQYLLSLKPVRFDFNREVIPVEEDHATDKIGFIAQEVEPVLPELVHYDTLSDLYSMDYVSLIPVLTKGFQEQDSVIRRQQALLEAQAGLIAGLAEQLNDLQALLVSEKPSSLPKKNPVAGAKKQMEGNVLYQNTPNPFSEKTTISYELTKGITSAQILIHSLSGQLIKTYSLSTTAGLGYISVDAGMLSPGMYTYSLSVNNRMVVTKRMVVTE